MSSQNITVQNIRLPCRNNVVHHPGIIQPTCRCDRDTYILPDPACQPEIAAMQDTHGGIRISCSEI